MGDVPRYFSGFLGLKYPLLNPDFLVGFKFLIASITHPLNGLAEK
jgi:hypothetical protein